MSLGERAGLAERTDTLLSPVVSILASQARSEAWSSARRALNAI